MKNLKRLPLLTLALLLMFLFVTSAAAGEDWSWESDEIAQDSEYEPSVEPDSFDYDEEPSLNFKPYACYWYNSVKNIQSSQNLDFYAFDYEENAYCIKASVRAEGSQIFMIYNNKEKLLTNNFIGTTKNAVNIVIAFDNNGNLWFVSESNKLMMIECGQFDDIKSDYPVYRYNYGGEIYLKIVEGFKLNFDDLADSIVLPDGKAIKLDFE